MSLRSVAGGDFSVGGRGRVKRVAEPRLYVDGGPSEGIASVRCFVERRMQRSGAATLGNAEPE